MGHCLVNIFTFLIRLSLEKGYQLWTCNASVPLYVMNSCIYCGKNDYLVCVTPAGLETMTLKILFEIHKLIRILMNKDSSLLQGECYSHCAQYLALFGLAAGVMYNFVHLLHQDLIKLAKAFLIALVSWESRQIDLGCAIKFLYNF